MTLHPDRIFGLGFMALAGGLYALNWQLTEAPILGDPGPVLLPSVIAVAMALLGLRLAIKPAPPESADHSQTEEALPAITRHQLLIGAGSVLNLLAYVILLPLLGYLPATLLFFTLGARLLGRAGRRSLIIYSVAALAVTLISYGLLAGVLAIHLPSGIWFDDFGS